MKKIRLAEMEAKTLIQKSNIPSIDYVINPYTGCMLACAYCYASFMGRLVAEPVKEWGNYVYVKKNAIALAEKELDKMSESKRQGTILISSVTDPYQHPEKKYQITRGILKLLADMRYPGTIKILTKSSLVTRDIDLLTTLPKPDVGMTVTTTEDEISRWLEVRAPAASQRLETLEELSLAGIKPFAFVGPLLPHFATSPEKLDKLFGRLADAGVQEVYMEHINLKRYICERMTPILSTKSADVQQAYVKARTQEHRDRLDEIVERLLAKHGLKLRFEEVVYHDKFKK